MKHLLNVFDRMNVYWAEIADQNQTEKQVKFIRNILKPQGIILDVACGTGRHAIPLSKEGYDFVGLDISPNLLKIAKTRLSSMQLVKADVRHLPFKPQAFAAAVSMDTSFGYLPTEEEDMESLLELHQTIQKGGGLIIDVFNRKLLMQKYTVKQPVNSKPREYPSFSLSQKRTVDKNGLKLRDLWTVCGKADGKIRIFRHTVRLYQSQVLRDLLKQAGFVVTRVIGGYEGQQFSLDSDRLILIACAK
ncbi:MAG: class I SAM-dependent methyltransferase [Candidatus Bathyarchaeia archaeon]|jgi:ubiquinone/menaquinone biosynthesis C-methylase UbiE